MIRFMHGFEGFDGSGSELQQWLEKLGFEVDGVAGANLQTVNTTLDIEGHTVNGKAIRLSMGLSAAPTLLLPLASDEEVVTLGFTYSANGWCRICQVCGIDVVWSDVDGRIHVGGEIGNDVLIRGPRWQVDVEVDYTQDQMRVWVNNELQVVAEGLTLSTDRTAVWGGLSAATVEYDLDDVCVLDTDEAGRTERLPGRIIVEMPATADVSSQWLAVPPITPPGNWQAAAQVLMSADPSQTLRSDTLGATDTYDVSFNVPGAATEIFAIAVSAYARKGDLDDRALGLLIQDADGAPIIDSHPLDMEYRVLTEIHETTPAGGPWTPASTPRIGIVMQ